MKKRRGLSEIISAIIVIAVVIAGLGLYTSLSQERILGETSSVKEIMQQSKDQISEQIVFVDMFRNESKSDVIDVYVHNYGSKNITIADAFVNGTIDMNSFSNPTQGKRTPIFVQDLNFNPIEPNNQTIPAGITSNIALNFTADIIVGNGIDNLVIRTESNKLIQIVNGT